MKRVLFFTLIHFAALGAKAHAACGFVPAFIHESIRDHADDPAIKQSAELALQHLNLVHGQRTQGLGGNGILIDDDDKNLPNEETPAGEQEIADETKALSNADKAATNSTSVETPNRRRQAGQVNKFVYNNDRICTAAPPKTLVRKPGSPVATDENVNNIWDQLAVIYDFYKTQFGRNSFDGKGGALHGTVHFCSSYNNALWDGIQMLFGDGDGTYFNSFTGLIDVTAHEVTHGVIQYSSDLDYEGESGALNEHLADVFGILVKQYQLKQTAAQSNWLIGEGLIKGARALRDMARPGTAYDLPRPNPVGKDPQPNNYDNIYRGRYDLGGVHVNSGIPNRAFYLTATSIGGFAWEVPGQVWYKTMTSPKLPKDATISFFARLTIQIARDTYNGTISDVVRQAWVTVGVPF